MAVKPKTFKIFIAGEVIKLVEEHTFQDGSKVIIETKEKIVVPSKKNQQRIAVNTKTLKPILLPSAQHEKWQESQMKVFKAVANSIASQGFSLPIARAKIKVLFYFPDSKNRDLSNKFETIADIMVDAGILMDDRYKVLKPIYLDGWTDRSRPRTEIWLTLITGDMKEYGWDITPPEHETSRKERRNLMRRIRTDRRRKEADLGPPIQ
jgi:Holliday junction resolvase RusA-like endonuclease